MMEKNVWRLNLTNAIVIGITFLLFACALFIKGFTHDLLLEVAVFLVSVKLILATYHIRLLANRIDDRLSHLQDLIEKQD